MNPITVDFFFPSDHIFFLPSPQTQSLIAQFVQHFSQQTLTTIFIADLDNIDTDFLADYPYSILVAAQPQNHHAFPLCKSASIGIFLEVQDYDKVPIQDSDYIVLFPETPQDIKNKLFQDLHLDIYWHPTLFQVPDILILAYSDPSQVFTLTQVFNSPSPSGDVAAWN